MPTYDYQCDACGHEFELFQGITEATKKKCPACKKMKLRRLSYKKGAAAEKKSKSESSSESKSEGKSDSSKKKTPPKKDSGSKSDS